MYGRRPIQQVQILSTPPTGAISKGQILCTLCTCCAAKRLQLNADKTEIWFGSANLRKLSANELNIGVSQDVAKPVTTSGILVFWSTQSYRCATTSRDWRRRAFFTYAVYAQCVVVVSSSKTSRNDWFVLSYCHDSTQAWTGHCAIVPWHRRPPSTNTGAPWPLRNFLTCALLIKILLSLWPLAYAPGRDDY